MSYKPVVLRGSAFYYTNINTKSGINLDKWLRDQLVALDIIPSNAPCCTTKQLYVKEGYLFRGKYGEGFNLNQYLIDTLSRLGVPADEEAACCPEKDLHIQPSMVFFSKTNLTGLQLINWLKTRLDYYSIPYTDPCCP